MKAKKIDHVGIVVKDLDAAIATYRANFGFEVDPMPRRRCPRDGHPERVHPYRRKRHRTLRIDGQ